MIKKRKAELGKRFTKRGNLHFCEAVVGWLTNLEVSLALDMLQTKPCVIINKSRGHDVRTQAVKINTLCACGQKATDEYCKPA